MVGRERYIMGTIRRGQTEWIEGKERREIGYEGVIEDIGNTS